MAESEDRLRQEEEQATTISPSAVRLFDVRRIIGGLFTVYGVIVTLVGVFDSGGQIHKAQGVRINLWVGLAMLVLGLLFLLWQWVRPAEVADATEKADAAQK